MKKIVSISIIIAVFLFGLSGCASLRGRAIKEAAFVVQSPEEKALVLSKLDEDTFVIVGFADLEDKRPKEDVAYMTSVREKVSVRTLETLRKMKLFDKINYPSVNDEAITIRGEIRRFGWESSDTMISYIPGLNVLPFLGLPSTNFKSEVEIYLEIKNNKTNSIILSFSESFDKRRKYNMYSFKQEKAEQELAYCFDVVLGKIKERININKEKILEELKSIMPKAPELKEEPREESIKEEPAPEIKPEDAVGALDSAEPVVEQKE
jgi:gas vesicle protein